MNISRKWLKEFVDITATDKEYDEIMTIAGQKVETTTRMDVDIKNVVVGKVLSMTKHENSDHMWVCMVDVGEGEPIQIVTGAQNVTEGDLVPVAKHIPTFPAASTSQKESSAAWSRTACCARSKSSASPSTTARRPMKTASGSSMTRA